MDIKVFNRRLPMSEKAIAGAVVGVMLASAGCATLHEDLKGPSDDINASRTSVEHEALAAQHEREARALHEQAAYYQQMADRIRSRGGSARVLDAPRYERLAEAYHDTAQEHLRHAERHRELAARTGR